MVSKLRHYASTKTKLLFIAPVLMQEFQSFDPKASEIPIFEASFGYFCALLSEIKHFDTHAFKFKFIKENFINVFFKTIDKLMLHDPLSESLKVIIARNTMLYLQFIHHLDQSYQDSEIQGIKERILDIVRESLIDQDSESKVGL